MHIAIVGCGNIAPFYLKTLPLYPELQLIGVMDGDENRSSKLSTYYSVPKYDSLDNLLGDRRVELVINLTNPRSHFSVSKACLEVGKHVYTEKPLAMSFSEAGQLVNLAEQKGLYISSAPSRILAETAQTIWKALRERVIGTVRLVYAEMDGGLIHRMPYKKWVNELGVPWPYKDEFEVGCTIEHAEYAVTWLTAFFGPVDTVTTFASCQIPDKQTDIPLEVNAPDFSVACLKFVSGVVARLTCSWIAPSNHSLRIFGDEGILCTDDIWRPRSPVYIKRSITIGGRTMVAPLKKRYPLVGPKGATLSTRIRRLILPPSTLIRAIRARARHLRKRVDFCLGIAELASAIREQRPCRLSARYCLHTNEVVLAIHNALETGSAYKVRTPFDPVDPMPWAKP
jgi:predicted dehydrogenase